MIDLQLRTPAAPPSRSGRAALIELAADIAYFWPMVGSPLTRTWTDEATLELRGEQPWLLAPVGSDLRRERPLPVVLPDPARARLGQLAQLRVPAQRLVVGLEVAPDGPVGTLLPELRLGPHRCSEALTRRLVDEVPARPGTVARLSALQWLLGGEPPTPPRTAPARSRVIYGVFAPEPPHEGDLTLWYELTRWRW